MTDHPPTDSMADETLDLPESVTVLHNGDTTIYVVGTAHISERSVQDVEQVIEAVQPDTVCVELCEARYKAITDDDRWKKLDIFTVIKEGKTLFLLANLALGAYQRKLGEQLGVKPGAEMLAGVKKAEEVGAKLELSDRDVHITLKRTWANLSFLQKMKLLGAMVGGLTTNEEISEEEIEKLKERDHLSEMMEEFARVMPQVKEPLIDERDQYLMNSIENAPGKSIVAIVGAGHVQGMTTHLGNEIDREALKVIPPRSGWMKSLKWVIPLLILGAFAWGISQKEMSTVEHMLKAWIIPNAVVCALFTLMAGAKLGSIVLAFFASPITSLNPLLGAGMVVGLAEAWQRKPTVADCERINEDVRSLRGVYKNAFTRVLLVTVMSTMGSAIGAWIGLFWIGSIAIS